MSDELTPAAVGLAPVLFVSDVHLGAGNPEATAPFLRLLREAAPNASALYLLGDVFDAWLGDDDPAEPHAAVTAAIAELTASGTSVFALHGNHDFLLGSAFAAAAGCSLLPDPSVVAVNGQRMAIAHGDALCTDDADYQAWRSYSRDPANQKAFLSLPLEARRERAAAVRLNSEEAVKLKAEDIMDVNDAAVTALVGALDVDILIHGHTHRPNVHPIEGRDGGARYVLGAWYDGDSHVLMWREGRATVMTVDAACAALSPHGKAR